VAGVARVLALALELNMLGRGVVAMRAIPLSITHRG
jgi:hypothetical protein